MKAETALLIRQVPLFSGLDGTEIGFLVNILREVEFPAGRLLFREGDPGDRLYVILDGEVEVVKALGTSDERTLAIRRAGEFFGEMSLFDPAGLRTASVRTRTSLRLLEMERPDFDVLVHHFPAVACEMIRVLSLRLDESHITTIADLREKNVQLACAYEELKAAQAQIIEKERLEKELETARWIQRSILPRILPRMSGYDFGATLVPARAVGGDLYDFIPLGPDALGIVIGDVSDKGVPAAIFMALTYSLLRAEAGRWPSPAQVLRATNQHLLSMNDAGMFVTLLYGVLKCPQARFTYARAGHELPLYLTEAGVTEPERGLGQPLGLVDSLELDEQSVTLEPDTTLLMYTDGATDLTNAQGERFGRERLQAAALACGGGSAQALCDRLWTALAAYQGSSTQFDDVALVAIRAGQCSTRGSEYLPGDPR
jgi:serine phosphatase RsbU (regulator of sigma subunit)